MRLDDFTKLRQCKSNISEQNFELENDFSDTESVYIKNSADTTGFENNDDIMFSLDSPRSSAQRPEQEKEPTKESIKRKRKQQLHPDERKVIELQLMRNFSNQLIKK